MEIGEAITFLIKSYDRAKKFYKRGTGDLEEGEELEYALFLTMQEARRIRETNGKEDSRY